MTDYHNEDEFKELVAEYDNVESLGRNEDGLTRFSAAKWCRRHGVWPDERNGGDTELPEMDECPDCGEEFKDVEQHLRLTEECSDYEVEDA